VNSKTSYLTEKSFFCKILIISFGHKQFFKQLTMSTGTVKFFNETKGFGFIKEDESGKEYFVHVTGL
jgi:hypothetical protein